MEIRAYTPQKRPNSAMIIRRKEDVKKAAPVKQVQVVKKEIPKELKKAAPKVETRAEKMEKLRKNFIRVHKKEAHIFEKMPNIHPFILHKAYEQSPWALELGSKYLEDPTKVHIKWFMFYLKSCFLAGEDYVRNKMANGEKLYNIVKEFGDLPEETKNTLAGDRTEAQMIVKFEDKKKKVAV